MMSASSIPKYLLVSIYPSVPILFWFGSSFCHISFSAFIISMVHFSMLDSIPISWLCILTADIRLSSSFPFLQTIWYCPCRWGGWFFSYDLWSLYPPVHFVIMWLGGIIAITNSRCDMASPWKISLWIYTSVKLFPYPFSSTLQLSMECSISIMISLDTLYFLRKSII